MVLLIIAVFWCRGHRYIPSECRIFCILHQNRAQNTIQCHYNNIWIQMCIKNYLIVLVPIFDKTYKGKNRLKNTCELYITNSSYSYKVVIIFAMYQRMRLKGTSWAGPRLGLFYVIFLTLTYISSGTSLLLLSRSPSQHHLIRCSKILC